VSAYWATCVETELNLSCVRAAAIYWVIVGWQPLLLILAALHSSPHLRNHRTPLAERMAIALQATPATNLC
jgi:hypothetical protein